MPSMSQQLSIRPVPSHDSSSRPRSKRNLYPLPLDAMPRRVLRLQLADLLDRDVPVLDPHHALRPELDRVDGGADRTSGAAYFRVWLVLVHDDRDTVVVERSPPEVRAVRLQQVAGGATQGGELAPAALAHQQRVWPPRLDQV